jgi:hypothetical protein
MAVDEKSNQPHTDTLMMAFVLSRLKMTCEQELFFSSFNVGIQVAPTQKQQQQDDDDS